MTAFLAFNDAQSQAQALAAQVAGLLRHHIAAQRSAVLAVSGGRSPVLFFEALSRQRLNWALVEVTLVDERLVPHDHPDSNARLVHNHLLRNEAAKARWRALVPTNGLPESEEEALTRALHDYRQPDVAVLGMGEDGHTASLFASAPELPKALRLDAAGLCLLHPDTAAHARLSMSLPALAACKNVFLSIEGSDKFELMYRLSLRADALYPVSQVLHHPSIFAQIYYS